jgi:hypothetical protein
MAPQAPGGVNGLCLALAPSPRRAWLPPAGTSLCGNRMISVAWVTGGRSALPSEWRRRRPGGVAGVTTGGRSAPPSEWRRRRPAALTAYVWLAPSPRRAWLPPAGTSLCGNRMISVAWVTGGRSALPSEWRRRRPGGVAGVTTGGRSGRANSPQAPGGLAYDGWELRRANGAAGAPAAFVVASTFVEASNLPRSAAATSRNGRSGSGMTSNT